MDEDSDTIYHWIMDFVIETTVEVTGGLRLVMPFTAIATRYHEGRDFIESICLEGAD